MKNSSQKLREAWNTASVDLGIEVQIPYALLLDKDIQIEADVLVKNFGGINGTLLCSHNTDDIFYKYEDEIVLAGYSYSVLFSPYETYDRSLFIDTLIHWGWSGSEEKRPHWISEKSQSSNS